MYLDDFNSSTISQIDIFNTTEKRISDHFVKTLRFFASTGAHVTNCSSYIIYHTYITYHHGILCHAHIFTGHPAGHDPNSPSAPGEAAEGEDAVDRKEGRKLKVGCKGHNSDPPTPPPLSLHLYII